MAPPSLGALCRKTAIANIDELTYVADLPYHKVLDILSHVRNDHQLKAIEENSPQIQLKDDELWAALAKKKFPVQLKKMRKLNQDRPLEIASWRDLYWKMREEDDEREAQAVASLEKTLMDLNKSKSGNKANLADPRRLPKRPRDLINSSYNATPIMPDRHFSPLKETPFQKVRREADKVASNRQLAIKARATPQRALSTVPKGLSEVMRIRRQPLIPMRSDKRPGNTDTERTEREYEERQKREARLLAVQKPKAPTKSDSIHLHGTNIPHSLQAALEDARKPTTTPTLSATQRAASPNPAYYPVKKSSNNLLSCPPGLQKAHFRVKVSTSTAPKPSTLGSTDSLKVRPTSSHGLSGSTLSPSATPSTDTGSDDDLFGDKTPKEPMRGTLGSPVKRPLSMVDGSPDSTSSTGPASSGGLPPRKKIKRTTGVFMPAKRAR